MSFLMSRVYGADHKVYAEQTWEPFNIITERNGEFLMKLYEALCFYRFTVPGVHNWLRLIGVSVAENSERTNFT